MALLNLNLKLLGKNVQEVSKKLKKAGIKGHLGSSMSCPLANYFRKEVEESLPNTRVSVDGEKVFVRGANGNNIIAQPLTPALRRFVKEFDAGELPQFRA